MRRDFRDKLCVYCGSARAETDDHIFSAKLFLEKDRGHLPEAPACRACNGKKSIWEHYLASVLPFGDAMNRRRRICRLAYREGWRRTGNFIGICQGQLNPHGCAKTEVYTSGPAWLRSTAQNWLGF